MFEWRIKAGELWLIDTRPHLVATGYSGAPGFKNNPAEVARVGQGPIPPGLYTIGAPHDTDTHGPYVLSLTPDADNKMYGRSGFLLHGDSVHAPGTASKGCICIPRSAREVVWNSGEHRLQVTL